MPRRKLETLNVTCKTNATKPHVKNFDLSAELRERDDLFQAVVDHGQALIWAAGLDKACFYFNQRWLDFTGKALEQELGDGWTAGVHPDDLQRCLNIYVTAFDRQER